MTGIQNVYDLARLTHAPFLLPGSVALFAMVIRFARVHVASAQDRYVLFVLAAFQFAIPVVFVLLGAFFRCPGPRICENAQWLVGVIYVLFLIQVGVGLYVFWEVNRYRLLLAALTIIQNVFSLFAAFVASMSVVGDWL